jgi:alpha-beta hydrolase superfamily lysophospholipase
LPPAPAPPPAVGAVIIHGAGSCKESHHDFARVVVAAGLAVIAFDQRGHGTSPGPLDGRAVEDVVTIANRLRAAIGDEHAPLALRGSSMGGYLAIVAAGPAAAEAVVSICPASAAGLRDGLRSGRFEFDADVPAVEALLDANDLHAAVRALRAPLLLLHAEGDERVPVQQSRELATAMQTHGSRLIVVPGGHHRSIQHDQELQAVSLRFIERALGVNQRRTVG